MRPRHSQDRMLSRGSGTRHDLASRLHARACASGRRRNVRTERRAFSFRQFCVWVGVGYPLRRPGARLRARAYTLRASLSPCGVMVSRFVSASLLLRDTPPTRTPHASHTVFVTSRSLGRARGRSSFSRDRRAVLGTLPRVWASSRATLSPAEVTASVGRRARVSSQAAPRVARDSRIPQRPLTPPCASEARSV